MTPPRKILYVHYQRNERDGSHVHTREFEAAFGELCQAKDIEFHVISPPLGSHTDQSPGTWSRLKRKLARYYFHDIKVLLREMVGFVRSLRLLRRERPDVVLTRFNGDTLSILWACRALGIPAVIEINGPDRDELSVHYHPLPLLKNLFTNRHALALAQGAFTVSEQLSAPLRATENEGKPVRTIPNGVDILHFNPNLSGTVIRQRLGISPESIVIGFVGSFAPWHGLDMLVDAFSRILPETHGAHLLLVGQPNRKWRKLLDRLEDPGLRSHITLAGFVPPKDIPSYLAAMDIATLPNSAYYCSPLKLFEYMAMAKPILSVSTEPVRDTLRDEEEALLFPQGDTDRLTASLARLCADPGLRERLGEAARRRTEREFTWRHNAEQVFDLLEDARRRFHSR